MKTFKIYEKLDGSIAVTREYGLEDLGFTLLMEVRATDENDAILRYTGTCKNRELAQNIRVYEL